MTTRDINGLFNRMTARVSNEWRIGEPIRNPIAKTGEKGCGELCAVFIAPPGRIFRNGNQIFLTLDDIQKQLDVMNDLIKDDFRGPYIPTDIPKSLFEDALDGIKQATEKKNKVVHLPVSKGVQEHSMQMAASMFVTAPSVGQQ